MIRLLALLVSLAFGSLVTLAQEDALAPAAAVSDGVPLGAFAATAPEAILSAKVFRDEIAKGIVEEAKKSTKLSAGEKRRIERVMRGGWFQESRKQAIITSVVQQLHAEQAIVVTPDGVQAAVDWENVLSIVAKLIPLIVQLISLFGGGAWMMVPWIVWHCIVRGKYRVWSADERLFGG
jgi:hypothetical protein